MFLTFFSRPPGPLDTFDRFDGPSFPGPAMFDVLFSPPGPFDTFDRFDSPFLGGPAMFLMPLFLEIQTAPNLTKLTVLTLFSGLPGRLTRLTDLTVLSRGPAMFHMPLFLEIQRAPNLTKLTLLTFFSQRWSTCAVASRLRLKWLHWASPASSM